MIPHQATDEAQVADQGGARRLQITKPDGGASLWTDQEHHGLPWLSSSWTGGGAVGMVAHFCVCFTLSKLYMAAHVQR